MKMYFFEGEVFAYEDDGSQDHLIPQNAVPLTAAEIEAHLNPPPVPPTEEEQDYNRRIAYAQEADPLFFKWQVGEATEDDWKAKREEIKARYPKPST